jgi:hypothetical protein
MNYKKIHDQIISKARTRKISGYVETHHIIPKSLGGSSNKSNLVKLTAREHYIIHKILVEMYPTNKKLRYALWGMSNQINSENNHRDYKVTSREYERARILFSESMKGRKCTWGDKIAIAKKGKSTGKQSQETIDKRKEHAKKNPYRHTEIAKKLISAANKGTVRNKEWRTKISMTHKKKGTQPPYRGIPYTYNGITYRSKSEASRILKIPTYKLAKQ